MAFDPTLDMDDQDDSEASSSADDSSSSPASPAPTAPAPVASSAQAVPPMNPQLAAYLQSKSSALASAQKAAASNRLLAGLARAGGTLASGSGDVSAADTATYNALDANADAPVKTLLASQKAEADAVSQKTTLDAQDPNSEKSKAVQSTIAKLYPGKFSPEDLAKVSAADAQDVLFKPLELDEKVRAAQQDHADRLRATAQTHEDAAASREDKRQSDAMTSTVQQLESARGNPAVQQAEKDLYSASKVNSLFDKVGDLNNLSPNMANLAIAEVAKMASGAAPDDHMLNLLSPGSFQGSLATLWQKVSNNPSPANAGAFLQQYRDYANALTKDAQHTIQDKYGRIIDSRSGQLGEGNVNTLNKNYINRFSGPSPASAPSSQGPQTVARKTSDGKVALFDATTKKFLRYQ